MKELFFMTIKHKNSSVPIMNRVATWEENLENMKKYIKSQRHYIAINCTNYGYVKGSKIKPSDLRWKIEKRIYHNPDNYDTDLFEIVATSQNW